MIRLVKCTPWLFVSFGSEFSGVDMSNASEIHRQPVFLTIVSAQCHLKQNHKLVNRKACKSYSDLCLGLLKRHQSGKCTVLSLIQQPFNILLITAFFCTLSHSTTKWTTYQRMKCRVPHPSQLLTPVAPPFCTWPWATVITMQTNLTFPRFFQISCSLLFRLVGFRCFFETN
jgi:hypothetical protein